MSVVACAAVGVGLLAPEGVAIAAWFGSGDYRAAAAIVPILTFGAFIRSYYLVSASVVLEDKRMKWVFKHAERCGADRLVMVMPDEWAAGNVRIKNLDTGEESTVPVEDL